MLMDNCTLCRMVAKPEEQPTFIAEFDRSIAFVYKDQVYRGRTVVVLKDHVTDIQEIRRDVAKEFYQEMMDVAKAVALCFHADRINYAMLGNRVRSHVHWHIIPRYKNDIRWGKAPWPHPRKYLGAKNYAELAQLIRDTLSRS